VSHVEPAKPIVRIARTGSVRPTLSRRVEIDQLIIERESMVALPLRASLASTNG
jgi:hypothetical protein